MKIVIIGASSGIGKALAELYLREGHQVGITGRRKTLLEAFAQSWPGNCFFEAFDVTGEENLGHVQRLIDTLGGIDLLIYSSGFGTPSGHLEVATEISTTCTNVNGFVEIASFTFNVMVG